MREIVFDTETTGLDPFDGHRVVEIGCVEVIDRLPTGAHYHAYINPDRDMPVEAERVHGLSEDFLREHKFFPQVAEEFLSFIGDSQLVAHNAEFDMKFINWELENMGQRPLSMARVVDTLAIARSRFPGQPNSLDALCKRLGVDNSSRDLHGALLDSEILAEVYLELRGGRQQGMDLVGQQTKTAQKAGSKKERPKRQFSPSENELQAHLDFLEESVSDPIWKN